MLRVSKKERVFFIHFTEMLDMAYDCSSELESLMSSTENVDEKIAKVSEISDVNLAELHKMLKILNDSFMTPIDREDIFLISKKIRSIISHIGEAAYGVAMYNIDKTEPKALELINYINKIIYHLQKLMQNFIRMRMDEQTVGEFREIGALIKAADEIYRKEISNLFTHEKNAIVIVKWNKMFALLEKVLEKCKEFLDIVEGVIIKNA